mmetsp:Transcript_37295/g.90544  ORF Transcript_37295/g.90544 Transcript_37295/m.90544 type:complete len:492 (-) Transcript_37295:1628-3103(-)
MKVSSNRIMSFLAVALPAATTVSVMTAAAAAASMMILEGVDGFQSPSHQSPSRQVAAHHKQPKHVHHPTGYYFCSSNSRITSTSSCLNSRMVDGQDGGDNDISSSSSSSTPNPSYVDRRKAITSTAATAFSLWLSKNVDVSDIAWAAADPDGDGGATSKSSSSASSNGNRNGNGKTILITGCNTGIGFEAARILARQGNTIVMACRSLQKATDAANTIQEETPSANLIPAECNLADLSSIKSFVGNLNTKFDVACYNAGLSLNQYDTEAQRTKDGFELTVGTNHLGHFYLNSLLLQNNKINTSNGKIVVTASGVHDPDSPGGAQGKTATLGQLQGLIRDGRNFEMVDGEPYNGDKAYKDSKLCNVFFCRELQRRLSTSPSTKDMTVNSFSPGLITTTGLFRYQSPIFIPIFSFIATKVAKVAETPEWGGAALAYMTQVDTRGEYYNSPPGSSKYGSDAFGNQFKVYEVSKEAQDDAKGQKLWELSEKLVGL